MVNIVSSRRALCAECGKMDSAACFLTIGNVSRLFPFPSLFVLVGVLVNCTVLQDSQLRSLLLSLSLQMLFKVASHPRVQMLMPPLWASTQVSWWPENHGLWAGLDRRVVMQKKYQTPNLSRCVIVTPALLQRKPVARPRWSAASEFARLGLALPTR